MKKNLDYILRTCKILKDRNINFEFHHIGTGDKEEVWRVRKYVIQNDLTHHVFLHGFSHNINDELKNANVFVSASKVEGHPIAVLEAMACQKTCFCSDIQAHREISENALNLFNIEK